MPIEKIGPAKYKVEIKEECVTPIDAFYNEIQKWLISEDETNDSEIMMGMVVNLLYELINLANANKVRAEHKERVARSNNE